MTVHPFRNLGLKALATALAVAMWFMVSSDAVVERSLRVPLEYQNIPDGLEIVGSPPSSVDVRVRGTSSLLGRVEPGDVIATLDLAAARPGERLFHIAPADVRVPMGVQVNQISPQPLSLAFERTISKVVPVVPELSGTPAQGFAVGAVAVVPLRVEVTGPESHVRGLTRVTTEPISLDGAREPLRERVALGVEDPAVRLAAVRSAEVAVEIAPPADCAARRHRAGPGRPRRAGRARAGRGARLRGSRRPRARDLHAPGQGRGGGWLRRRPHRARDGERPHPVS
jgi:hypothetical protein